MTMQSMTQLAIPERTSDLCRVPLLPADRQSPYGSLKLEDIGMGPIYTSRS